MKRYRIWMLGAFVLVSALLVGAVIKRNWTPIYQLSRYSKSAAFQRYIFSVAEEMEPGYLNSELLLDIHEPADANFNRVLGYEITRGGSYKLNINTFDKGNGGSFRQSELSGAQLSAIEKLIRQLPPDSPPPKSEDLVVVVTKDTASPKLRLYDRKSLPVQVREIVGIITAATQKDIDSLLPGQTIEDVPHLRSKLRPSDSQRAIN